MLNRCTRCVSRSLRERRGTAAAHATRASLSTICTLVGPVSPVSPVLWARQRCTGRSSWACARAQHPRPTLVFTVSRTRLSASGVESRPGLRSVVWSSTVSRSALLKLLDRGDDSAPRVFPRMSGPATARLVSLRQCSSRLPAPSAPALGRCLAWLFSLTKHRFADRFPCLILVWQDTSGSSFFLMPRA